MSKAVIPAKAGIHPAEAFDARRQDTRNIREGPTHATLRARNPAER
jgi:hypothetical protein